MFNFKNSNSGKIKVKLLATMLVLTLTFANFALVGSYIGETLATEINLSNQDNKTNISNVKFDLSFDAENKNQNEISKDINANDLVLYATVTVENAGVLKDAKIELTDANFELKEGLNEQSLNLGTIQAGTYKTLELPIQIKNSEDKIKLDLLDNMTSKITLTGKYNNDDQGTDLNAEKYVKVNWTANDLTDEDIVLTQKIITNKVYKINETDKRVIQMLVTLKVDGNKAPVEASYIEIANPEIGITPSEVKVASYGTQATNGKTFLEFNDNASSLWEYLGEENKVIIGAVNEPDEQKNISWEKDCVDKYVVTYIYDETAELTSFACNVAAAVGIYGRTVESEEDNAITKINKLEIKADETEKLETIKEIGNIVNLETATTKNIYKGNMYIGQETNYKTASNIYVSYKTLADSIVFSETANNVPEELTTIDTYFKETRIDKASAIKILGETGKITVWDADNKTNPIQEINLAEETDEDYYTIKYEGNVSNIEIEMSPVAEEGIIEILNEKVIKTTAMEDEEKFKEEISGLTGLESNASLKVIKNIINNEETSKEVVETISKKIVANLLEPVSNAEFGISKTEFSSTQQNDVNFTVTLKTDDISCDLYENPVVTITLPEIVKNIEVTAEDIEILNNEGNALTIANLENKNNQIRLTLAGKQASYSNANTQISINAKITTDKFIPTLTRDIVMSLENGKETIYPNNAEKLEKVQAVNFKTEQGILLATSLSNYNSENKTITSFGEDVKTAVLETLKPEATTATVKGTIINNTKEDLQEVKIFGKVQNNGTSINAALNSEVQINKKIGENANLETVVYYTQDANPTLESNWVENIAENTTAYLVVCKNLEKASVIELAYNVVIPAGLTTNKDTHINYEVYSNNQTYVAPIVKLQTPKEIKLDLELTSDVENGKEVFEGQGITYNIKVTNTGNADAQNVQIISALEGLTITEGQAQLSNLNIKAGETIQKQIKATVNKGATKASFVAEAKTEYLVAEAKGALENQVIETGIELNINKTVESNSEYTTVAQIDSLINYELRITNALEEDLNDVQIKDILPEELNIEELNIYRTVEKERENDDGEKEKTQEKIELDADYNYNEETREIVVNVNKLKQNERIYINIYTSVKKVVDSNIINSAYVTANEKYPGAVFSITDKTDVIGVPKITSSIASNAEGTVQAGDIIEYTIKVKNEGETKESIEIKDEIPEELEVKSAYYYYGEEQAEVAINLNNVSMAVELEQNQEITIKITAQVKEIEENKEIENYATITGTYTEQTTNAIKNVVEGVGKPEDDNPGDDNPGDDNPGDDNPGDDNPGNDNPGDEPVEYTYSITGIAWQDENKNGARDAEEQLLKDIVIKLIDAESNQYILNNDGDLLQQKTNENGEYELTSLKPGKYIVVFEFDQKTYSATSYQKTDVDSALNSDARLVTEENNNIVKTDIIEIKNQIVSNIDIGLVTNPTFDLKLDKYITKVTVQNSRGTETYEYDKTQLAKVEIPAKALDGSLIIVEYQIDVTNEGELPGQVDAIVDYVSPQYEFISELNTSWYKGTDKNLYCIDFANENLNPGETKSVKLVLTKTMTNDNTGLVNNAAEIYEVFNEYAYSDVDSTPANKAQEDDLSEADIIISIRTGGPLLYIGIVIISMLILSVGIYLINKKLIKNYII